LFQAQAMHTMALLYERPLGLFKEALKLEKAAFKVYRLLLGDKHHLTVRAGNARGLSSTPKQPSHRAWSFRPGVGCDHNNYTHTPPTQICLLLILVRYDAHSHRNFLLEQRDVVHGMIKWH
jgi:hypothetical protein